METTDVRTKVLTKLAEHSPLHSADSTPAADQRLSELELDSLAILEVLYDLEDYYSITVEPEELPSLATVNDLVNMVDRSVAGIA